MKSISFILFLIGASLITPAQITSHVLKGRVTIDGSTPLKGATVANMGNQNERAMSDSLGFFILETKAPAKNITISKSGYETLSLTVANKSFLEVVLVKSPEVDLKSEDHEKTMAPSIRQFHKTMEHSSAPATIHDGQYFNTESYSPINENGFHLALDEPLSTFSIDVDRASYSNMRRFINNGSLPPIDAVRIEEMINYFDYSYPQPEQLPIGIHTQMTTAPWHAAHQILHIGIQAKELPKKELPPSNLVFLIDVSGSMSQPNKLPLLKSSIKMLVSELRPEDKVSIVVYAGAAGCVLEPTPGNKKKEIDAAIDALSSGGPTAGGAGIELAYKLARKGFLKNGNNRVILATDGDFNVGPSSDGEMQRLIEQKREEGIFLTVLGFGMGNYKDSKMETLADKGNGNYAYIDNINEARKMLVGEFGGTLYTLAKDVKVQVEFNPQTVASYRLIGYENRLLNNEDFNDDKKDAGEMGVGHSVTVLYEIVPTGEASASSGVGPLKYSTKHVAKGGFGDEAATVKVRYKTPDGDKSKILEKPVAINCISLERSNENTRWAIAVASFGMLLRNSEQAGELKFADAINLASSAIGTDPFGYRRECLQLMQHAQGLSGRGTQ